MNLKPFIKMKKITNLFGLILLLGILSCSKNEITKPLEIAKPLLKTIEEINPSNGSTVNFTYDGYRIKEASITSINAGLYKNIYTYTGDLITQEDGYLNEMLLTSTLYTYENNKLKTTIYKETNSGTIIPAYNFNKLVYTYESENIVSVESYTYSKNNWELIQPYYKVKIYFSGGNIIKREYLNSDGLVTHTESYEYDNKNNIYKNILGLDKLFFLDSFSNVMNRHLDIQDVNNANNLTRIHLSGVHYDYNYNSEGYPIEKLNYYYDVKYIIEKKYTYY